MGQHKKPLILFVIAFLLIFPVFVSASWNVFSVVGEPKCNNENTVKVNLEYSSLSSQYHQSPRVDTKNIDIWATAQRTPFNGDWSSEYWNPGETITLEFNTQLFPSSTTDFTIEWLFTNTNQDPSYQDALSGSFNNPCYDGYNWKTKTYTCDTKTGTWIYNGEVNYGNSRFCTLGTNYKNYLAYHTVDSGICNTEPPDDLNLCVSIKCGDSICNSDEENCNNCLQDCSCNTGDECFEFGGNMRFACVPYVDITKLASPKELDLNFNPPASTTRLIHIKGLPKDYFLSYDVFWQNGTVLRNWLPESGESRSESLELYSGDVVNLGLNNFSKDGQDLSIKLLERQGDNIKLLFSKPAKSLLPDVSKFNFDKKYLYYGIIALVIVIIFSTGFFYISKRKKKVVGDYKPLKEKDEIIERETKEKIPSNITEAITITGFGVKKGSNTILENINFSVKRGEFVSLLGPSGSGKSTIIEILAGRRKPSSGKVKILGKNLDEEGINGYIGFVPQSNEIYLNQTVLKNLENSVIKWGIKNSERKISEVLEQVNLVERKNLIASKLSGGQQKLLSLAMELIRDPELLILDEPTTGLDPNTRNQIITLLCNLSRYNKKTVLITTHFMDDSEECDEVIIINNKKVVADGSPDKLKRMLPGSGKMVTLVLDNSDKDLLEKIRRTKGIERVIAEGRTLNILTNNPNAVEIANKVHEYGGYVNESKISKATMKEVFVFFTGRSPEE